MFLYHYYDKMTGPFMNLSELANEEANFILNKIKENKPKAQSAQRIMNICLEDVCMRIY